MAANAADVYMAEFTIPVEWWSATDTIQTETIRAKRRRWVKEYAYQEWMLAKKQKNAHKVERFVAVIGVAYPRMDNVVPSRAAETVKPIIDAGTRARLWPDDDAHHRCGTLYFQMPEPTRNGMYRLTVWIFPVPDRNPVYQLTGGVGQAVNLAWNNSQENKPQGWSGYTIQFVIPHRLWISSNLTDSDLKARQHGARKARTWGGYKSFGMREKVTTALKQYAQPQWELQPYWGVERFIILAGISYPHGVGYDQADPDNVAETVNALMRTGVDARAWHGTSTAWCKGVGFFRDPRDCQGGEHVVRLMVLPVPDGMQLLDAVVSSYEAAWEEQDRRLHR